MKIVLIALMTALYAGGVHAQAAKSEAKPAKIDAKDARSAAKDAKPMEAVKKVKGEALQKKSRRWDVALQAVDQLTVEGTRMGRITAKEASDIRANAAYTRKYVADRARDGITEAEEDQIDDNVVNLFRFVATSMAADKVKAPSPAAKSAAAPAAKSPAPVVSPAASAKSAGK